MTSARIRDLDAFFEARVCRMPEIGLLQPAEPILDAAGEDIRRRIFITQDQAGRQLCLRPEFTIPVCLDHIASGRQKARYGYFGTVFRQRKDEAHEFLQAGCEDIGAANAVAADARSLADAVSLLRELGAGSLAVETGDQAIFEAVLASLGLPKAWRERLGRGFGEPARLKADLDRLSGGNGAGLSSVPPELGEIIATGSRDAAIDWIAAKMHADGLPAAGRSADEIAARLFDKAELASASLSRDERLVLDEFLSLDVPAEKASRKLWAFAAKYRIVLGEALEDFDRRCKAIRKLGISDLSVRYRAAFGRRLDYYTGFVFEVRKAGKPGSRPLAGGGRYDRLLNVLGARGTNPAVGYSVWVDRVGKGAKGVQGAKGMKSPAAGKADGKSEGKPAAKGGRP